MLHHDLCAHHENIRLTGNLEHIGNYGSKVVFDRLTRTYSFESAHGFHFKTLETVTFKEIWARDVIEHLPPDRIHELMEFFWNNLEPDGLLRLQVPQWGSENAIIDPTHYRGFHIKSFDFFDPETPIGKKNAFYGLKPWKITEKYVVPKSDINLAFVLRKRGVQQ